MQRFVESWDEWLKNPEIKKEWLARKAEFPGNFENNYDFNQ